MPHAPKKSPLKQLWLLTNKESSDPEISAPLIDILCNKYKGQWNLKDIDVNDWALSNDNIGKFCAFLKTQKNLETLDIGTYANLTVSKVKQVMNAIEANFKAAGNAQKTFRIRKGTNAPDMNSDEAREMWCEFIGKMPKDDRITIDCNLSF